MKRTILVTGSTDGIGKQTALELAAQGSNVILHGRDDESCLRTLKEIKGFVTEDASMGDTVTIETVIGRKITGELVERNSSYNHSFGHPPAGFTGIGVTLRRILNDAR